MTEGNAVPFRPEWETDFEGSEEAADPLSIALGKIGASPFVVISSRKRDREEWGREVFVRAISEPGKIGNAWLTMESNDVHKRLLRHHRIESHLSQRDSIDNSELKALLYFLMPTLAAIIGTTAFFFALLFFSVGVLSLGFVCAFGGASFLLISIISFRIKMQTRGREWRQRDQTEGLLSP